MADLELQDDKAIQPDFIKKLLDGLQELYLKEEKRDDFIKKKVCLEEYLSILCQETSPSGKLSQYIIDKPYAKGGTGIILKAKHGHFKQDLVIKFNRPRKEEGTVNLVENELTILPALEHSNIIRVIDVARYETSNQSSCPPLSIIVEPLIPEALKLQEYVLSIAQREVEINEQNLFLLDESLIKLVAVLKQWVEALIYVHKSGYAYLDVKPDNTIVDRDAHIIMIDFGTCQVIDKGDNSPTAIFFSKLYAHPRIKRSAENTSTNRVRSALKRNDLNFDLDYYALGKSIIELLEILSTYHSHDFPQRPLFQSLHFLATRLLDGENIKNGESSVSWIGNKIQLNEVFDRLVAEDYKTIKYTDLKDVKKDLEKELGNWDPEHIVPELSSFPASSLREVPDINTALTKRLLLLIEHPLFARLKMINQLGLITTIYPTADHTRFDHSIGAFTYTASYIKALFNDSQNCLFRNLINEDDIKAALLAALLHDLGQYPLAHDLQEVHPKLFDHSSISVEFLDDDTKDRHDRTIRDIIENKYYGWGLDIRILKKILQAHSAPSRLLEVPSVQDFKADMLSALIDGPIDADKADYIVRDSIGCRITYGSQLDIQRLLSVLTTVRIPPHYRARHKVTIGIYEKGAASASAFSLARFLLHSSVYWHHTSRILKAMLHYGAVLLLPEDLFASAPNGRCRELRERLLLFIKTYLTPPMDDVKQGKKLRSTRDKAKKPISEEPSPDVISELPHPIEESSDGWHPGICRTNWLMLSWLKGLASSGQSKKGIALIDSIQLRCLYKRVYTINYDRPSEPIIKRLRDLTWNSRIRLCQDIQQLVSEMIIKKQPSVPTILNPPQERADQLFKDNLVILVDIPNYEKFQSDRPLIFLPELQSKTYFKESAAQSDYLDDALNSLMKSISQVRVLCHPELRQRIGACISPEEMKSIIDNALSRQ